MYKFCVIKTIYNIGVAIWCITREVDYGSRRRARLNGDSIVVKNRFDTRAEAESFIMRDDI